MSDFLGRLAGRSLGVEPVVQPVIPAMTAPAPRDAGFSEVESFREAVASAPPAERAIPARAEERREVKSLEMQTPAPESRSQIVTPQLAAPRVVRESAIHPTLAYSTTVVHDQAAADPVAPAGVDAAIRPPSPPIGRVTERRETLAQAAPIIRVTIGRVEVRAEIASSKEKPAAAPQARAVALSLDDYLKQRGEGRR
ncbi:MAG TPA: hypothetical protein VG456_02860 [Candidatus Sulfopaludibacter sp.]|jgi:hypothetical protein|nr:hypothetical protein [Candidatus Sulfopaludibacter sp.]